MDARELGRDLAAFTEAFSELGLPVQLGFGFAAEQASELAFAPVAVGNISSPSEHLLAVAVELQIDETILIHSHLSEREYARG